MAKRERGKSPLGARLEHIRKTIAGCDSLSAFHSMLLEEAPEDFTVSDAAVRYYHMGQDYEGWRRDAPWPYLRRVLDRFPEVRAEWLVRGDDPPTRSEEAGAEARETVAREREGIREAMNAAAIEEMPAMEQAFDRTWTRLGLALETFAAFKPPAFTGIVFSVAQSTTAPVRTVGGDQWAADLQRQFDVAVVRVVMTSVREMAAPLGVNLDSLDPEELDEYMSATLAAVEAACRLRFARVGGQDEPEEEEEEEENDE